MWRKLSSFPLLLMIGLSIVACSNSTLPGQTGSSSATPSPILGPHYKVLLVVARSQAGPLSAQLNAASAILSQRLTASGFRDVQISQITQDGQPGLRIDVPRFDSHQSRALEALLVTGQLEFWSTGLAPVTLNQAFDPTQYTTYNPGNKPWFTGKDLDASQVRVGIDQLGRPQINFAMKGDAVSTFFSFTQKNVGEFLTITLDRKVLESAVIAAPINGPAVISGTFTQADANHIATLLKYEALPISLVVASEEVYTQR